MNERMFDFNNYKIIDISQPVEKDTACFPGDVPFSRQLTVSYAESKVINLTAFTMSPHVGSHADSPGHIKGDLEESGVAAGDMPLLPFLGPCAVVDLGTYKDSIRAEHLKLAQRQDGSLPARILFKTTPAVKYDVWEGKYAYLSGEAAEYAAENGVILIGLDTPSVDHVEAKVLVSHNILHEGGVFWLENLDLGAVAAGEYFLIALPLKLMEVEASPVRAVLLSPA